MFAVKKLNIRFCFIGLKQLGDQMHIVTRTISNPPSVDPTPTGTPSISMRKLALLNNNRITQETASLGQTVTRTAKPSFLGTVPVPDEDDAVFKPSTHVMRREDSDIGVLTTASKLHHQKNHTHAHS